MRLRHTVGATLGALALVLTIPTSANAVQGDLFYKYGDPASPKTGSFEDPAMSECLNVIEVEGKNDTAFAPESTMQEHDTFVFTEEDCQGTKTKVPPATKLGPEVKFKSILVETAT
ncbi:hypothetical protein [Streptomyces spectabilis]|uniref:Uncharacterized protein n=1 Tax=Streptomyces spectabilis TaxID=68270 RepID=A0A5P2XEY1_STRST|nr:hypothetical protein [Streptomyces spectabilis]MBB5109481.1 hypothetical protein [Streptomyces spectabilis]MCI3904648.1 hypothetical protein [Streptomyces spectabilis]QEV61725.1 hypothetical protein CP982_25935 [Streptomyces spectabilis]GGV54639.1 hypothetical protein GCM10010245_86450 [Streptomyces spectabilis]